MHDPRERLIAAALRVAAAERGGLDGQHADIELHRAGEIFDGAVREYVATLP